jgi:pilus assembly protein TadC
VNGRLARLGGIAFGVFAWVLLGGWFGCLAGVVAAALVARVLIRVEPPGRRQERARALADLPFAADLLAAALRAGTPTDHGLRVVGTALGGALGRQFVRVADGLRLGLEPVDAWDALRTSPESGRFADAVSRTADSGAAVARALDRLADALRSASAARVESAAQRLGVLMVLPLGLCFLPAFVFAGIAPVIVAVLGDVLQ